MVRARDPKQRNQKQRFPSGGHVEASIRLGFNRQWRARRQPIWSEPYGHSHIRS